MASIGSVSVDVVPDATDFWRRFVAATRPGAFKAGEDLGRDVRRGMQGELAKDVKVRVKADTKQARTEIAALRNDVSRGSGGMIKNLLALSPALVPLGAAAAAAGAEFVALGATGVLAITGIKKEIDAATPNGAAFAGLVRDMRGSLAELQSTAAGGVLRGFEQSAGKLRAELPALNEVIARQSVLLGSVTSSLVGGLVGGFQTFAPLLDQVGASVARVAAKFEAFATGPAGGGLGKLLSEDYAKVAPIIDDIATAVGHIIAASHGVGLGILTDLGLLARVVSSFPTPVLQGIIAAFVTFRAAAAIQGVANSVSASFAAMGARVQLFGLQNQAAAAQAALASAQLAEAAAASAVAQTAAAEQVAAANLAQVEAIAASTAAADGSYTGRAAAAVASAQAQVNAAALASRAAVANADVTAAASAQAAAAQQAAAARVVAAQRTASGGMLSTLGPIGLLAGGLLLLGSTFGDTSQNVDKSASSLDSYTSALQSSNGAINDSVRASVAKTLADTHAFETAKKYGISQEELTDAVIKGGSALKGLNQTILFSAQAHQQAGFSAGGLAVTLTEESKKFREAQQSVRDQEAALIGLGSATGAAGEAIANGTSSLRAYVAAVQDFNKSADTAADRGKLIGEALRAANGDAISYQNTLVATAKANQQLVTDFVNLKKGVLDLKTGTLDYHNAAAAPLLADLQALQDANVKAAAAVYQHEVNTRGGAAAATDAYNVYVKNTRGALIDQANKLGLTTKQAKRFADQYLGIKNAGDLKKKITLLGEDKVTAALKGILEDLDILVGKKPLIPIKADGTPARTTIAGVQDAINYIRQFGAPGIDVNTTAARNKIAYLQQIINNLRGKSVDIITRHVDKNGNNDSVTYGGGSTRRTARADGGLVSGPGTSTSDSIPALLSNGEFVVKASQTKKHKGLLRAINAGIRGFASGGEVGGYSGVDYSGTAGNGASRARASSSSGGSSAANLTYVVGGTKYDTLAQAKKAAAKLFRENVHLGLVIDGHDLRSFRHAIKGTVADARQAFSTIYGDLKKLKISDGLAKRLRDENKDLLGHIAVRNRAADNLKKVQAKFDDLKAGVKSAITGSFDITSAGTGFDGQQPVTGANILAQAKQQENRVKLFVRDIRKLQGKLNGTYLRQLALQGPDALPQVEALVKLPKAQLAELNRSQATIAAQGASLGTSLGVQFYGDDIKTYTKQLKNETTAITHLADKMQTQFERAVDKLDDRPIEIKVDGKVIARVVNAENKKQGRRS